MKPPMLPIELMAATPVAAALPCPMLHPSVQANGIDLVETS